MVERGEVHIFAAYGIVEYFLKTGYHRLQSHQIRALASMFPLMAKNLSFEQYKGITEHRFMNIIIPGMSFEESWVVKREIMDLMEIATNLQKNI